MSQKSSSSSVRLTMKLLLSLTFLFGCDKNNDENASNDIEEVGQQVGDVMASLDESGGSSGSYASIIKTSEKMMARLSPPTIIDKSLNQILPMAHATTCLTSNTFSSCSNNVIQRSFSGCTIGLATLNGTVDLTFDDASVDNTCSLVSAGNSITRNPNFSITGRRGATLSVIKSGTIGQKLTLSATANQFSFSNDGIRRKFSIGSTTILDFTTETTSDLTVSGSTRANRVVNGGTLKVTNNITERTCEFTPSNVTWDGTCNCAISGSWTGSCSDSSTSNLTINGCGMGTLTIGADTNSVTFDRCYSL